MGRARGCGAVECCLVADGLLGELWCLASMRARGDGAAARGRVEVEDERARAIAGAQEQRRGRAGPEVRLAGGAVV